MATPTLDATLGGASANSYITVAQADDLMALIASAARAAVWAASDSSAKPIYLMRAVKLIEQYMCFQGYKIQDSQPLEWPRYEVYGNDRTITPYPETSVPPQVQEAQALMALNLLEGFDTVAAGSAPVNMIKVASIQIDLASTRAARGQTLIPSEVIEKLYGFAEYIAASGLARSVPIER